MLCRKLAKLTLLCRTNLGTSYTLVELSYITHLLACLMLAGVEYQIAQTYNVTSNNLILVFGFHVTFESLHIMATKKKNNLKKYMDPENMVLLGL